MRVHVLALHGFLGRGSDWAGVQAVLPSSWHWDCPDLFGPDPWSPGEIGGDVWLAGYSYGARLALRLLARDPGRWCGALLLSCNPGNFQTGDERVARRAADALWGEAFLREDWETLMKRWAAQPVLAGVAPQRKEKDFCRGELARALREVSVGDDFTDPACLPEKLAWLAGARDEKFSALLDRMRESGFPGVFYRVPGAGHRLPAESPEAVASAFRALVDESA